MKRFILSALTVALMLGSFNAQADDKADAKAAAKAAKELLKSFNNDLKEAKKLSEAPEKPDFAAARAALAKAKENANAQDNPEYYFAAGQVEFAQFNNERNKPASGGQMDEKTVLNVTAAAFEYYQKAYALYQQKDPKNKNITTLLQNAYECFNATSAFRANAGNLYSVANANRGADNESELWIAARNMFDHSIEATHSDVIKAFAAANPLIVQANPNFDMLMADSTITQTAFNRAVCALFSKNHELAIKDLEFMKDKDYEPNTIMQSLAQEYLAIGDSVKFEEILKEGAARNLDPEQNWYGRNLLNIYLDRKDYASAATFIDEIIKTDPDNANFVDLKGRLLEMQGDIEGALASYKRASELDPTLASVWSNLGRIYFNRASDKENELYDKKRYDDVDKVAGPLFQEALPYYENAFAFDTERKDNTIANAMRTILYKQFQKPSCPNKKELIAKYNEVSAAYGLPEFK